jgi:hypothetical protein
MTSVTWFIQPRDPVVVRDGKLTTELGAGAPFRLPLPGTVAGMVRACFARGIAHVAPDDARTLLEAVRITRGPWLTRVEDGENGATRFEPWAPMAADVAALVPPSAPSAVRTSLTLRRGTLKAPQDGEGVLPPPGIGDATAVLRWLHLPNRDDGAKVLPAESEVPFWPLTDAVLWALSNNDATIERLLFGVAKECSAVEEEMRIHVVIEPGTGTAEAGMLFGTPGLRFADGFGLAVEIEAPATPPFGTWPGEHDFVQLGGESRPSARHTVEGAAFPAFAAFKAAYAAASEGKDPSDALRPDAGATLRGGTELRPRCLRSMDPALRPPAGLRLQLLTPGALGSTARPDHAAGAAAWLPTWLRAVGDPVTLTGRHPALRESLSLRLVGACVRGFVATSGWNLQANGGRGGPRRVRRLVPAGSVYYFEVLRDGSPAGAEGLIEAAEALWGQPMEPEPQEMPWKVDPKQLAAHPAHDGHGLMLPGFFWDEPESASRVKENER